MGCLIFLCPLVSFCADKIREMKMRKVILGAFVGLTIGAGAAFAEDAASNGIATLDDYVAGLVTIDVTINGETMPFLFDTGGGATLVTPEFAAAIGCEPWGRWVGYRMSGEQVETQVCGTMTIDVDGTAFEEEVGVFDISSLLPPELPVVGGILSLSAFKDTAVTLDMASAQLIFESDASLAQRTSGTDGSEMRLQRELAGVGVTVFVPVATDPGPLWFLVDSANIGAVIVAPHAQEILQENGMLFVASDDTAQTDLELAGTDFAGLGTVVMPIIYDGVVDLSTLHKMVITMDLAQSLYWTAAN